MVKLQYYLQSRFLLESFNLTKHIITHKLHTENKKETQLLTWSAGVVVDRSSNHAVYYTEYRIVYAVVCCKALKVRWFCGVSRSRSNQNTKHTHTEHNKQCTELEKKFYLYDHFCVCVCLCCKSPLVSSFKFVFSTAQSEDDWRSCFWLFKLPMRLSFRIRTGFLSTLKNDHSQMTVLWQ